MTEPTTQREREVPRRGLGRVLAVLFFGAMFMGAGPGVYLVNGRGPIIGMPAIYVWVVCWYFVQAAVVVAAFRTVWKRR